MPAGVAGGYIEDISVRKHRTPALQQVAVEWGSVTYPLKKNKKIGQTVIIHTLYYCQRKLES
jgi:hypothetical protein